MKFLKRLKFYLFFIFICLFFFIVLFVVNQFFQIKKVELIADRKITLANESELVNKNLIFIDKEEVRKLIIQKNSLLKKVTVDKIWPSTLRVTVYLYEPIASLIVNQGYFDLSFDGRILSKKKDNQSLLPIINYYQKLNNGSFQTGDWISFKDIQKTLFFINVLEQINLTPLTIDIIGQDMLVFNLKDSKKIIFSNSKNKETQDYQLELIIKQFKIEGKEFKKIDLRFEKPVITF
jgi:cell division septal protein FtsQ